MNKQVVCRKIRNMPTTIIVSDKIMKTYLFSNDSYDFLQRNPKSTSKTFFA